MGNDREESDPIAAASGYGGRDPATGARRWYDIAAESRLGGRIRELRKARGWSQEDLAGQLRLFNLDMHQTTVAKLEGAMRPIRVNEAVALALIFGVSLDDLIPPADVDDDPERAAALRALQAARLELERAEVQHVNAARVRRIAEEDFRKLSERIAEWGTDDGQH